LRTATGIYTQGWPQASPLQQGSMHYVTAKNNSFKGDYCKMNEGKKGTLIWFMEG
jgi:hypothetical protein